METEGGFMKSKISTLVDNNRKNIIDMSDFIFDNPELGGKEYKAYKVLTEYLTEKGFDITHGVGGLETAFKGEYQCGEGGPTIGLLCEYDALENMGHACGHHMQGPVIVHAAMVLKELIKDKNYSLVVYGTPAEETFGGKVQMLENGCFRELDVALMMHASPTTTTDIKSLAMNRFIVEFHGISSHSALKPENGRSALDGILLLANGIEYLREHVKDDVRIHYSIINGGGAANVVPKYASAEVLLRSYDRIYLDEVAERFKKIVKGASLMTETDFDIILDKKLNNKIPVMTLNNLLMKNAEEVEAPRIRPAREKTGSTDFGNVMYEVPGSCIRVAFVSEGASAHSEEYLKAGKSEEAHQAEIIATKVLAYSAYEMIADESILSEIKDEFQKNKKLAK